MPDSKGLQIDSKYRAAVISILLSVMPSNTLFDKIGTCPWAQFGVPFFSNRPFYSCVLSVLAWIESEAGVDLALIETSLPFLCK